jgi:hypothetical protein
LLCGRPHWGAWRRKMYREEMSILWYRGRFYNFFASPGEHHFCSVYLLNKFNRIPDYINPDGTKGVAGDIVFCRRSGPTITSQRVKVVNKKLAKDYKLNKHAEFSIEVKYGKIKFTKDQYNTWFVDKQEKPDFLIALTDNYLFIIEWNLFEAIYSSKNYPEGNKSISGYSKIISENDLVLFKSLRKDIHYFSLNSSSEKKLENKINTRFKKINGLIENKVKNTGGNNIGPTSNKIRTTERLFKIPKELITEEIYKKYKAKIESCNFESNELFCDNKGQLYYKISNCDYMKYNLKIPELTKD